VLELRYGHAFAGGACGAFAPFLVRRAARLYPLFLVCNALVLPLHLCSAAHHSSAADLVASLFLLTNWLPIPHLAPPLPTSWSVSAFFCLYATFPVLSRALDALGGTAPPSRRLRALAFVSCVCYLVGGLFALHHGHGALFYRSGVCAVPCFLVGMCAGRERRLQGNGGVLPSEGPPEPPTVPLPAADARGSTPAPRVGCVRSDALAAGLVAFMAFASIASSQIDDTSSAAAAPLRPYVTYVPALLTPLPAYALLRELLTTAAHGHVGVVDAWVLRSRPARLLGQISLSFSLLHAVPILYVRAFVAGRALLTLAVLWGLTLPLAWLLTEYIEKPAGRALLRWHERVLARQRGGPTTRGRLTREPSDSEKGAVPAVAVQGGM
jgi:peptidoglycan/LPS O-acetylase OafA/YrhL